MRLGYLVPDESMTADALLAQVAQALLAKGLRVAGAIQHNHGAASNGRCHMDLEILTGNHVVRISQDLGPHARGCRLDPGALEEAVGQVIGAIHEGAENRPEILIVNKFGKQEIEGRGFRPAIGAAMAAEIPVFVIVPSTSLAAFEAFSEGVGEAVVGGTDDIADWCLDAAGKAVS
jgi:nucleoside-triphosphatase THEP1